MEKLDAVLGLLQNRVYADKIVIIGEETVSKELVPSMEMINEILQELKEHLEKYGERIGIEIRN